MSGVETLSPSDASIGTSSLAEMIFSSPAERVNAGISLPASSYKVRLFSAESQEVLSQNMEIEFSSALPRFSTISHALAESPIRPYPVLAVVPAGPLIDNPRVRFASTGSNPLTLTFSSSSSVSVRDKYPASDPSAFSGALILREGVQVPSAVICIDVIPPGVWSLQVHPCGRLLASTSILQTPASRPVERIVGCPIVDSPGLTLTGLVGISNVALYGGTMVKLADCASLS